MSSKDLRGGKLHYDKSREINEREFLETHRRTNLEPGDILLTNTGASIGRVGLAQHDKKIYNTTFQKSISVIKANTEIALNTFLYYSLLFKSEILIHLGSGAAQPNLLLRDIRNIQIPTPPLAEQKRITGILSAYDDLIENNLRRIKILEEMAQSLYREWFVHFRFPNHETTEFQPSSMGSTPKGWEIKKLGKVASVNEESIRANNAPKEIHYIDIKSVSTGNIDEITTMPFSEAPSRARRMVKHGDVIWSTVRPNRRSFAAIINPIENLIASTGFAVLSPKSIPSTYLFQATTTEDFTSYLVNHATGAAYPAVNATVFKNVPVLIPRKELLNKFDTIAAPLTQEIHTLGKKNQNLRKTRDLLLPKLLTPTR